MKRRAMRPTRDPEAGSVALWVVLTVPVLFAGVGLVVDGGYAMAAKGQAIALAYQAARTGAQQLDLAAYATTGSVVVDPTAAREAARAYLAEAHVRSSDVQVQANRVQVELSLVSPNRLLDLFGLDQITVTAHGSATATYGMRSAGG